MTNLVYLETEFLSLKEVYCFKMSTDFVMMSSLKSLFFTKINKNDIPIKRSWCFERRHLSQSNEILQSYTDRYVIFTASMTSLVMWSCKYF